jgi:hypothetical protein
MTHKIQIFQSFHKPYPRALDCSWITPVRVGQFANEHAPSNLGDLSNSLSDATGESISALNPHYCELTAQYWVWKNRANLGTQAPEIVGFYHYRRYLNFLLDTTWQGEFAYSVPIEATMLSYLTSQAQRHALEHLLGLADVVIPARFVSEQSVQAKYFHHHPAHTWLAFEASIKRLQPSIARYLPLFACSNRQTVYNMFVMPWAIFDVYCQDLFEVIDASFALCDKGYGSYNDRYPGFLAERYLGLWLHAKGLRCVEVPMLMLMNEAAA